MQYVSEWIIPQLTFDHLYHLDFMLVHSTSTLRKAILSKFSNPSENWSLSTFTRIL